MKKVRITFLTGLFLWASCLQGPWEYLPDTDPVFRGLTVNAYIISGRSLENVCIERLYSLDEPSTLAFAFYDSAVVTVTGDGGGGEETVTLSPREDCPTCFEGPDDFTGQHGEVYFLNAVVYWDSAGENVVSTITGEATIPATWKIDDVATVNRAALPVRDTTMAAADPQLQELFGDLPPEVIAALTTIYFPEIEPILSDTAALMGYFNENGSRISGTIDSLLSADAFLVPYRRGDTLLYMTGSFNLLSHYYKADFSEDIGGVLLTHHYEKDAITAFNAFDNIAASFGPLEPSSFYVADTVNRIFYFPVITGDAEGAYTILDAIPVINAYFEGGKNTVYFYATDTAYAAFVRTYIEQHTASNVKPVHSVKGGQGFFAGMAVDSFTLYMKIPEGVQAYYTFEARADYCSEEEWDTRDCRCFEPEYCMETQFNDQQYGFDNPDRIREPEMRNNCLAEAVAHYLAEGKSVDYVEDSLLENGTTISYDSRDEEGDVTRKSKTFLPEELENAREEGVLRYCIRNNFDKAVCEECRDACREGGTPEAEALYTWCEDNLWRGGACEWAMALYCRVKENPPKALCEKGNKWCEEHPEDELCR